MQMDLPLNRDRAQSMLTHYLPKKSLVMNPLAHTNNLIQEIAGEFHPQVRALPVLTDLHYPQNLNGLTLLNLARHSTQNNFVLSHLVGKSGSVIALENNVNIIDRAERALIEQEDEESPLESNLEFFEGEFARLHELCFAEEEFDLILSHLDLKGSDQAATLLAECYRILSEGGELVLTEIFSSRRCDEAFYLPDFVDMLQAAGFLSILVSDSKPSAQFYQLTLRLFKMKDLEKREEDYGQMVKYNGGVLGMEEEFRLSLETEFTKGKWQAVSGNTYLILNQSRFEHHFDFAGDFSNHFGAFKP
jgi:arsenite methyltransferase